MKYHRRLCALFLAATLFGTGRLAAQATLSLRGGPSIATLSDHDGWDARTGLSVGALVTFGISQDLGIQIGGSYVQKGAAFSNLGFDARLAIDYIEVPVLLRLGVPTSGAVSPHFFVGPTVSFVASCEAEILLFDKSDCTKGVARIKSIDFGGMAGVGLDLATSGALAVTLDALYNLGFSSLNNAAGLAGDGKNRAWSIVAGVGFPIG